MLKVADFFGIQLAYLTGGIDGYSQEELAALNMFNKELSFYESVARSLVEVSPSM